MCVSSAGGIGRTGDLGMGLEGEVLLGCGGSLVLTRLVVGIWWVSWVDNDDCFFSSGEGEGGMVECVLKGGGFLLLGGKARGEVLWVLGFCGLTGLLGFAFGVLLDGVCGAGGKWWGVLLTVETGNVRMGF